MNLQIEIDNGSGFCFGVTTAIRKAEEELAKGNKLYCLGDIVHNGMEVERLHEQGLITIDHEQLRTLHNAKVLLRAHGEPPQTYEIARQNNIEIIDATCPVVLALQSRIKRKWSDSPEAQTVIFGKKGHAEVLGLVGQTHGEAIVVESLDDVKKKLDFSKDINLYSQTTKNLDEYRRIVDYIQNNISSSAAFKSFDTIVCGSSRCHSLCQRAQEQQRACPLHALQGGQRQQPSHRTGGGNRLLLVPRGEDCRNMWSDKHPEMVDGRVQGRYPALLKGLKQ